MHRISKSRLFFFLFSAALVVPLLSGTLLGAPTADEDTDQDSLYKYLSVFTEVLRLVRQVYVEEPDIRNLMAGALDGAADALDPFSTYVPAEEVEHFLAADKVGAAHSGLMILKERGVAYVAAVIDGSPADLAGLKQGDIISELGGRSSRSMPVWRVRELLAAEAGTKIDLEIVRRGETIDVTFELGPFEAGPVRLTEVGGVPVLRIPQFSGPSAAQLDAVLASFEQDQLLIDLRGVAGGEPEVAYALAERFVEGDLGRLVGDGVAAPSFEGRRTDRYAGRLGVLVDHATQGPAEILAQVLRQGARATLLGGQTYGHAGRISLVTLESGGLLEITDAYYTGPDGEALDKGLEPDLEVELQYQVAAEADDDGDPILDRAVELFLAGGAPVERAA